jgi:hypothetical protein
MSVQERATNQRSRSGWRRPPLVTGHPLVHVQSTPASAIKVIAV